MSFVVVQVPYILKYKLNTYEPYCKNIVHYVVFMYFYSF